MTLLHRALENIRTNGRDPVYRKSLILSVLGHLAVLVIIPSLLRCGGCTPPGDLLPDIKPGDVFKPDRQVRIRPENWKKRMITNPNSPILWLIPELDDSPIPDQIERETKQEYTADPSDAHREPGHPDGCGKSMGFPGGFTNGRFRFVRLEYDGEEWDDGMDSKQAADINFLAEFRKLTGVSRTALRGESQPIQSLAGYRKGEAPPFVYITGSGRIDGVGPSDLKTLQNYIRDGGMIFADCGSPRWHSSFLLFARRLLPGVPLIEIADDDPILREPFSFPDGAPALWHHGGFKAMGMKMGERWVVFYHPGDINDAWKTQHSGLLRDKADAAYRMGVNVAWYACRSYMDATAKYRKNQ